jgi:signal peptidase I
MADKGSNHLFSAPLANVLCLRPSPDSPDYPVMKKTEKKKRSAKSVPLDGKTAAAVTWQVQIWEYGKAIALAVVLALFIRSFIIQAFHIPSSSMVPTFLEGDRVLVSKFSYGFRNPFTNKVIFGTGQPARGDVVIFKFPQDPDTDFVKRVIGLPGEKVEVVNGRIKINDQLIEDQHGHYDNPFQVNTRNYGPVTVPPGQYFMMGDNRDFSNDSRGWGFVDSSLLRGKAWRLYWSWDSSTDVPFFQRLRLNRIGLKIE